MVDDNIGNESIPDLQNESIPDLQNDDYEDQRHPQIITYK